jgi:hypothetical protein
MRTYDPADSIRYVHLAQEPPPPAALPDAPDGGCRRLPSGYANQSPETRLSGPPGARPTLVVLPGGAGSSAGSAFRRGPRELDLVEHEPLVAGEHLLQAEATARRRGRFQDRPVVPRSVVAVDRRVGDDHVSDHG